METHNTAGEDAGADEIHDIFVGMTTETEFARVDSRLEEFAGDLARLAAEVDRAESTRRSDMEMIRVRIQDALTHVRETTDEHRAAWHELEARLVRSVDELKSEMAVTADALRKEMTQVADRAGRLIEELELRLQSDVETARRRVEADVGDLSRQIDVLCGELETQTGEVQASRRLALSLDEAVAGMSESLRARLESLQRSVGAEQDRLIEALATTRTTIEEAVGSFREATDRERTTRSDADRAIMEKLDDEGVRLERLERLAATTAGRHDSDVAHLERQLSQITDQLSGPARHDPTAPDVGIEKLTELVTHLATRVEQTEKLAQEAGRAIVAAIREVRNGEHAPGGDAGGVPATEVREGRPGSKSTDG